MDQRPGGGQSERRTDYITVSGMTVARVEAGIAYRFYHTDHLGSSAVGTASNGSVLWEEYNTPFGEVISSTPYNDDQAAFTGHIRDSATGLNYMQARYYDPVIGRFLSIDPVTFVSSGYNPNHFNRYAYAFNNPVNLTDPDGRSPLRDMYYSKMSTGGKLPDGMQPAGTPVTGSVAGDLLLTVEGVLIAADVIGPIGRFVRRVPLSRNIA